MWNCGRAGHEGSPKNISPERTAGLNDGSDRRGRGNPKVIRKDAGLPGGKIRDRIERKSFRDQVRAPRNARFSLVERLDMLVAYSQKRRVSVLLWCR